MSDLQIFIDQMGNIYICKNRINSSVRTAIQRTPTIINLRADLVESLNKEAMKHKQQLDTFIENILMEVSFDELSKDTLKSL